MIRSSAPFASRLHYAWIMAALTFVVLTLPMGMLTSWLSARLAVKR